MKSFSKQAVLYLILTPFLVLFIYPFLWLITACFKTNGEIYKPMNLIPEAVKKEFEAVTIGKSPLNFMRGFWKSLDNWDYQYFSQLFSGKDIPFWDFWGNSLIMTSSQALLAVLVSAATAYFFVFRNSKWNRLLFMIAVALILIPRQIMIYPLREFIFDIKLNDNLLAVILPGAVSGIGIIFFIQIYKNLPRDYVDLARMEGASETRAFLSTIPLLASAFICCFMIHFLIAWQMHLIPLQLLDKNQLLPVGVSSLFSSSLRYNLAVVMCAGIFCILPAALLFSLTYKRFRSALSESIS